ncbi:MAG: CTP synthase [Dehalococcoidia bacterium]|jgi:CTP synthase|nr:CTP synthase [Dehalococcoidia bacterium]MDW8009783.1 CTP synthase [Chloroflexota bacterium]
MGTKYIFVTGGVVSSVGKGITTAAIGRLLKSRGFSVVIQKLDPYLNVDPGTMSPYQHGEVFVTADGAETDLDLGHYERFLDQDLTGLSSVTAGQIYQAVIARERRGDYLGRTIQAVPHVTNEIKERIRAVGRAAGAQIVVVEVGGTVGDIEGQPFLEAIRQMRNEEGRDDTLSIHVTLLPYLSTTGELKTKPTQHSVRELRSLGIQPDVIVCRSDLPVGEDLREKISLFCDVPRRAVVPLLTMPTIYEVPLVLEEAGLGDYIGERLGLPQAQRDLRDWQEWVERLKQPQGEVEVAVVGKYVELPDAYLSVKEALIHAGVAHHVAVRLRWVHSQDLEHHSPDSLLEGVDGIVVPGGFGERGVEGKIAAARHARQRGVPYLGLCLGMQVMVMEYARHVLGWEGAHSTEFDPETPYPVICLMEEQLGVTEKGGTMRLGSYPCQLRPGTVARQVYGTDLVMERHRHRYEFNNRYRDQLERAGLICSGTSPDGELVEVCEVQGHPFMVGSQFHPEFRSRPGRPHPLFLGLIGAALERRRQRAALSTATTPLLP